MSEGIATTVVSKKNRRKKRNSCLLTIRFVRSFVFLNRGVFEINVWGLSNDFQRICVIDVRNIIVEYRLSEIKTSRLEF